MVKATGTGGYGRRAGARNATAIDLEAASQFFRLLGAEYCTFQPLDRKYSKQAKNRHHRKHDITGVIVVFFGHLSSR
jgi:hypothetical protein